MDDYGNEKFILNDEGDFEKVFCQTPPLYAYGKEMLILKGLSDNHPSGNPQPSIEDINVTKRLIEIGKLIY